MCSRSLYFFIGVVLFLSCNQNQETCTKPDQSKIINPNGESELALFMRAMYEDAEEIRSQIEQNETINSKLDYTKLFSAIPTDTNQTESETYKSLGQAHIQLMKNLSSAKNDQAKIFYNSMVENCKSCHTQICPGPLMKIKHLRKFNLD
ncbi:MAG: hypothetical protein MRY83_13430 [Flavobacteriales bacterium]|nr:hypothetical protein [Flavobacteriales bacterium]